MSDTGRVIRKFERMMGHSHEELMEMGRQPRHQIQPNPGKIIGHFTYDFENKTETFTPTLKYRIKTSINKLYSQIYSYFRHKKIETK